MSSVRTQVENPMGEEVDLANICESKMERDLQICRERKSEIERE